MVKKINLENIRTQSSAVEVISMLEDYKQNAYKKSKKPVDLSKFGIILSENTSADTLNSYITSLKDAPVLNIISAAPLDEPFIETLYSWFKSSNVKDFLISTSIDPAICGGLVIEYKGLYHDLSLKSLVSVYVQQRK